VVLLVGLLLFAALRRKSKANDNFSDVIEEHSRRPRAMSAHNANLVKFDDDCTSVTVKQGGTQFAVPYVGMRGFVTGDSGDGSESGGGGGGIIRSRGGGSVMINPTFPKDDAYAEPPRSTSLAATLRPTVESLTFPQSDSPYAALSGPHEMYESRVAAAPMTNGSYAGFDNLPPTPAPDLLPPTPRRGNTPPPVPPTPGEPEMFKFPTPSPKESKTDVSPYYGESAIVDEGMYSEQPPLSHPPHGQLAITLEDAYSEPSPPFVGVESHTESPDGSPQGRHTVLDPAEEKWVHPLIESRPVDPPGLYTQIPLEGAPPPVDDIGALYSAVPPHNSDGSVQSNAHDGIAQAGPAEEMRVHPLIQSHPVDPPGLYAQIPTGGAPKPVDDASALYSAVPPQQSGSSGARGEPDVASDGRPPAYATMPPGVSGNDGSGVEPDGEAYMSMPPALPPPKESVQALVNHPDDHAGGGLYDDVGSEEMVSGGNFKVQTTDEMYSRVDVVAITVEDHYEEPPPVQVEDGDTF